MTWGEVPAPPYSSGVLLIARGVDGRTLATGGCVRRWGLIRGSDEKELAAECFMSEGVVSE